MRAATPTEAAAEAGAPFLAKKPPYGHGQWKVWTAAEASAARSGTTAAPPRCGRTKI